MAVDRSQRLDGVDVLRPHLGAARLGQERRVRQRRAGLGLRRVQLELLVLPAKPLGVGLLDLLAGFRIDYPLRKAERRVDADILGSGVAQLDHFHVVEDRPVLLSGFGLVLDRHVLEQRHDRSIGVLIGLHGDDFLG